VDFAQQKKGGAVMSLSSLSPTYRIKRIEEALSESNLDLIILSKPENAYWLSIFQAIIYTRPVVVAVQKGGDLIQLVPYLELEHAKKKSWIKDIRTYSSKEDFSKLLKKLAGKAKIVGLDLEGTPYRVYEEIKHIVGAKNVRDVSDLLAGARMLKGKDELERIELAAEITDLGMETIIQCLGERLSEIEVANEAESVMKRELARKLAKSGIYPWMNWSVAALLSGPRSFYPHGMMSGRKVRKGDICVATLDIAVEGYRAENERTLLIGNPSGPVSKAFDTMVKAQVEAIKSIKPGALADAPDIRASKVISNRGFSKYIKHRTGHGIGLEIHEKPSLAVGDGTSLRQNMTLCVEPGIYIPNVGGFRHSDTVLVTSEGAKPLTKTPKYLGSLVLRR
jgi:Xaa-Pro dipeptidase